MCHSESLTPNLFSFALSAFPISKNIFILIKLSNKSKMKKLHIDIDYSIISMKQFSKKKQYSI